MSKNQNSESPFGDYGIVIKCLTFKNINVRKIDMLKITNAEYLIDHRYAFNIVKWDQQELVYSPLIRFNGNNFINTKNNITTNQIQPAHIWLKDEEAFQSWLGEYYSDAITATLSDPPKEETTEDYSKWGLPLNPNPEIYDPHQYQWSATTNSAYTDD